MVKYRIPDISEFVQDFEFEYKMTYGGGHASYFMDGVFYQGKKIRKFSKWISTKVWWLPRTREEAKRTQTYDDGTSVTWFIHPMDKPFNIESMLENNKIRVKYG